MEGVGAAWMLSKGNYFVQEPLEWLYNTLLRIVGGLPDFPEGNFKNFKYIILKCD